MAYNNKSSVEQIGLSKIPEKDRKNWLSIGFIWSGILICVPALMVGGMVGTGMPIGKAILSMIVGYAIVLVFMIPLGMNSADLGLSTVINASRSFGTAGSRIIVSTIIAISMVGWFGFQANVCANSFSLIMNDFMGINIPIWVSSIIWGSVMLATAVYGIGMIRYLNMIAVPLLLFGLLYGLYYGMVQMNGATVLASYRPEQEMSFLMGMNLTIAGIITAAVTAGDYTRYAKNRGDTIRACIVGVVPAGVAVLAIGGILAVIAGTADLTIVLSNTNLPILGLLILIFATWTTATSSAYAAGLATLNIFNIKDNKRALVTLILGVIGIALAIGGIIDHFLTFLTFLTNLTPPVAGVLVAEYFVFCKGTPENWKPIKGINIVGVASWLFGVLGSILLGNFFIPSVNAIAISFIVYIVLRCIYPIKENDEITLPYEA